MAGWGSAFATAFKIVIMSIVWAIIGIILIAIGISMMGMPIMTTATQMPRPYFSGQAIVGLIVALIGYVILLLGTLASFLKYSAEYYAEEVRLRGLGYPQQGPPPGQYYPG